MGIWANRPPHMPTFGWSCPPGKAGTTFARQSVFACVELPHPIPHSMEVLRTKDSLSWLLPLLPQGGPLAIWPLVTLAFALPLELSTNKLCLPAPRLADLQFFPAWARRTSFLLYMKIIIFGKKHTHTHTLTSMWATPQFRPSSWQTLLFGISFDFSQYLFQQSINEHLTQ